MLCEFEIPFFYIKQARAQRFPRTSICRIFARAQICWTSLIQKIRNLYFLEDRHGHKCAVNFEATVGIYVTIVHLMLGIRQSRHSQLLESVKGLSFLELHKTFKSPSFVIATKICIELLCKRQLCLCAWFQENISPGNLHQWQSISWTLDRKRQLEPVLWPKSSFLERYLLSRKSELYWISESWSDTALMADNLA